MDAMPTTENAALDLAREIVEPIAKRHGVAFQVTDGAVYFTARYVHGRYWKACRDAVVAAKRDLVDALKAARECTLRHKRVGGRTVWGVYLARDLDGAGVGVRWDGATGRSWRVASRWDGRLVVTPTDGPQYLAA